MTTPEERRRMATVLLEWVEENFGQDYPLAKLLGATERISPAFTRYLLLRRGSLQSGGQLEEETTRMLWNQVACYLTLTRAGTGVP